MLQYGWTLKTLRATSQSWKDKYWRITLIRGTKSNQSHRDSRWKSGCQRRGAGGDGVGHERGGVVSWGQFQFGKMKKFWRWMVVMVLPSMKLYALKWWIRCILLQLKNYHLKIIKVGGVFWVLSILYLQCNLGICQPRICPSTDPQKA